MSRISADRFVLVSHSGAGAAPKLRRSDGIKPGVERSGTPGDVRHQMRQSPGGATEASGCRRVVHWPGSATPFGGLALGVLGGSRSFAFAALRALFRRASGTAELCTPLELHTSASGDLQRDANHAPAAAAEPARGDALRRGAAGGELAHGTRPIRGSDLAASRAITSRHVAARLQHGACCAMNCGLLAATKARSTRSSRGSIRSST